MAVLWRRWWNERRRIERTGKVNDNKRLERKTNTAVETDGEMSRRGKVQRGRKPGLNRKLRLVLT